MPEEKGTENKKAVENLIRRNNIRDRAEAVRNICYIYEYIQNGDIEVSEEAKNAAQLLIQELSRALCTFVKDENKK